MTDQPSTGVNPAQIDTRTTAELLEPTTLMLRSNANYQPSWKVDECLADLAELARRADESAEWKIRATEAENRLSMVERYSVAAGDESRKLREELQRSLDSELLAMRNNEHLRAELERAREMLHAWQDSYGTGSPNPYEIAVAERERSKAVIDAATKLGSNSWGNPPR